MQGVLKACDEIERNRNEAQGRPRKGLNEAHEVEMLESLKVTDDILEDINETTEFIEHIDKLCSDINRLLSSVDEQDGLDNLKEGITSACVGVKEILLNLAQQRVVTPGATAAAANSGECRSQISIKYKSRDIRRILKSYKLLNSTLQ